MKKIFNLALVAAAAISANAAENHRSVTAGMNQFALSTEVKTHPMAAIHEDFASRAEDDLNIEGRYAYGLYSILVYGSGQDNIKGQFLDTIVTQDGFEIVKDPEVENGYIIKNFLYGFWNQGIQEEEDLYEMADIKATFDPATRKLTVAPYQYLFTMDTRDEQNKPIQVDMHIVGTTGQMFDKNAPIEFTWDYGIFAMTSTGFTCGLVEDEGANAGLVFGPGFQFGGINAFIPNGTYSVETDQLGQREFPILGVWKESPIYRTDSDEVIGYTKCYVVNFSGFDMLRVLPLVNAGNNRVKIDAMYGYTGWNLMYYPDNASQPLLYNEKYFAAEVDSKGYPTGDSYELYGTIEEETGSRFVISFPEYGLFSLNDVLFGNAIWENGVLTFAPNTIAGIETVNAAADNTNAPVVYYNLQGMRVNNPAAGNLYIRVQGTDVTKIIK